MMSLDDSDSHKIQYRPVRHVLDTRSNSKMEQIGFSHVKNHEAVRDAARVEEGLRQYRAARVGKTSVTPQVVRTSDEPKTQIQPEDVAALFADAAVKALNENELNLLLKFLRQPPISLSEGHDDIVQSKIDEFKKAEIVLTGLPDDRLVSPSGPNDAEIGIMLHCQSKKGPAGSFWDLESPSIQGLIGKGLSDMIIYGFDWHWRAEESARRPGRATCPTSTWPTDQRRLHDAASYMILDQLPLPLLLVGGICAKKGYRNSLAKIARQISISLSQSTTLTFEIDYREGKVRRIAAYIPHPASIFFHPAYGADYSIVLDIAVSFYLWLSHRHQADVTDFFSRSANTLVKGISGAAPLQELYGYRKREGKLGRKLRLDEYDKSFQGWAARYLGTSPATILNQGDSLADEIIVKIGRAISKKAGKRHVDYSSLRQKFATNGRKSAAKRYGYTFKDRWDGQIVQVTKKGYFSIFLSDQKSKLQLYGGARLYKHVQATGMDLPIRIYFESTKVVLKQADSVIFSKDYDAITEAQQQEQWKAQARRECMKSAITQI